jgi:hypothetical protein
LTWDSLKRRFSNFIKAPQNGRRTGWWLNNFSFPVRSSFFWRN